MEDIKLRPGGLELTAIAAKAAALTKDSCVLDIGCGTGASLYHLWNEYGCCVAGIDCSEKAIAAAKARFRDADPHPENHSGDAEPQKKNAIRLIEADAAHIPFPDASFDLVMMECTLTLFAEPMQILREACRVLRSDGTLFVSALTKRSDATDTPMDGSTIASTGFSTDASTTDTLTNASVPCLTENGLLHTDTLCACLPALGFHHISCTERNDALIQFAADAIFSYGSVENYIREASACIDGCVLNCSISPREAGYAYVLARKI